MKKLGRPAKSFEHRSCGNRALVSQLQVGNVICETMTALGETFVQFSLSHSGLKKTWHMIDHLREVLCAAPSPSTARH